MDSLENRQQSAKNGRSQVDEELRMDMIRYQTQTAKSYATYVVYL